LQQQTLERCVIASSSHDNRQDQAGIRLDRKPRIGRLRRRSAPLARPSVSRSLVITTITLRGRFMRCRLERLDSEPPGTIIRRHGLLLDHQLH